MATLTTNYAHLSSHAAPRPTRGFFARFIASVQESRMRQAEREIAHLIESRGGRLTDDVERQIERSFI